MHSSSHWATAVSPGAVTMSQLWFLLSWALLLCVCQAVLLRKNVDHLSSQDLLNLQKALREVVDDKSAKGFDQIASYHGYPAQCKDGARDTACCVHGDLNFPTWHRLYVVQIEQALKEKGLTIGVPYWDWTEELHHLPSLVDQRVFLDSSGGKTKKNAWYQGTINKGGRSYHTARAVDKRLYQNVSAEEHTDLFEHVLHAFEYKSYCQFEVQFEIAHNTIHSLVGGRYPYSLSSLDYTAYDPLFYLHHSNVDRLYAIYQLLQKLRGTRASDDDAEICDVKGYFRTLEPFSRPENPFPVTKTYSSPDKAKDYSVFGYEYESLTLNGLTPEQILDLVDKRKSHERSFAVFSLHNIGVSADIKVRVCLDTDDEHEEDDRCLPAGDFFVLGGSLEMNWSFPRPFYFEITEVVRKLHVDLQGNYHVEADIYSVNGTQLPSSLLPHPYVSYRPAAGAQDEPIHHNEEDHEHEFHDNVAVRKSVDRLSREEINQLREALNEFQNDKSVDGYQAIAEFHGDPGKCPTPTAKDRHACCIHGQPTFPHWHRLLVTQVEDALRRRGSPIGVPYWDWTQPNTHVPAFIDEEKYIDPETNQEKHNPFHDAQIAFLGGDVRTTREVSDTLTQNPEWGDHTELYDAFLLALEQDDFCEFAVQFEVAHNLIHGLIGGSSKYGLSTLSYSAFDPIFYIHHSNIDRIWAIWTALQQHRKKPYKAHCAQSYVHTPLKPFAFQPPFNNDAKTRAHSVATHVYDYEEELAYTYDNLEFGGLSIPELENYINNNIKNKERIFVGIQLHGIKKSGIGRVIVETYDKKTKFEAGRFAILGGPTEMPWRYDRLYKHEITHALEKLQLHWAQPYFIRIEFTDFDNNVIDSEQFGHLETLFTAAKHPKKSAPSQVHVRKDVDRLTSEEVHELRHALTFLEEDKSIGGYQTLGRYHGSINWCPSPSADRKYACCPHGMPTFPHWHRLLVVQFENALASHGYTGAVPYWDWTRPLSQLPELVTAQKYLDKTNNKETVNPFYSAHIDDVNHDTVREIRSDLFKQPKFGQYTTIAKQVLLAFEQDDFCDFEVQFEIAHNFIHALVGGSQEYSLASLTFTAYDPLFYLHHSNTDRLWAIWQALQKYRGKDPNTANCAIGQLRKPLAPFSLPSDVNPDPETREHSEPREVFDYKKTFHYDYDSLEFNGLTVPQIERLIQHNKDEDRVFAGFILHGIQHSALVKFSIKKADNSEHPAGEFYILGDVNEKPWAYDRVFKYEITDVLEDLHLRYDDRYTLTYKILNLKGDDLGQLFPQPTVIRQVGTSHIYGQEYRPAVTAASQIRRNLESLSEGEVESLRSAFLAIQQDHTYESIASFHGKPGLCEHAGHKVACCVHGNPTFPSWHRLYVELVEQELLHHGSAVAVPYWDWIHPIHKLPKLISKATYFNSRQQRFDPNPFFSGKIPGENAVTTRDPQPELFDSEYFLEQALFALEQDHYCDFEVQFEIVHNALHSWLGGHARYSMSSLDYAAFDPVFFLHHANTDRLWAIWQELQRYRGLPYNEADCAINLMRKPLRPFSDATNSDELTKKYSRPIDTFDYRNHFHYEYDTLKFNNLSIPELEAHLQDRKRNGRVFAGFLIHNIGLSADVDVYVCVPVGGQGKQNCQHKAGTFSILGGETEMPFEFDRLYKLDITRTVRELGLRLNNAANFQLKVDIRAPNGSHLDSHTLHEPSIIYIPGTDEVVQPDGSVSTYLVRKNVDSLSPLEGYHLAKALIALKADSSADGYQSIAAFHAIPPLCPSPEASRRYACCIHGGPSFLQWHRLYTVQFEDALRRHGSPVGVPYWDWTRVSQQLPRTFTFVNYTDPFTNLFTTNPFYSGRVEFEHVDTERDIQADKLFKRGPHGWDTWLYTQVLYALEQEDFCDFEVQLEVAHNAIHSWIGGSKEHSLAHLHYASYDPAFFIHHSNTDRLFAVWQRLQEHRKHDPNAANCALERVREPLKPFSFGPPYNLNKVTQANSHPEDTFAYKEHFHYKYDALEFVGMDIPTLDAYIKERKEHDRVFAGFLLKGIGQSANIRFEICNAAEDNCFEGGYFSILGGAAEMPWTFDRLYKYEITDQLESHNIHHDDEYHLRVNITTINGAALDPHLLHDPTVIFVPAKHDVTLKKVTVNHIRRNLNDLDERDIQSIQAALHDLINDPGTEGWATLASFHGAPARCPDPEHPLVACCQHGMPTFLHWHRLFTLQVEQAVQQHGSSIAIPYWDWTLPILQLPQIFTKVDYYDAWADEVRENPFAHGYIPSEKAHTVRDVQPELFETSQDGKHSALFPLLLEALEQTNYCDFVVQFEVLHNAIHYLVGGHQTYSLSSLEYSAYDPIFFIHHSFTDKLWVVWQELQQRRHLPYHSADCAVNAMNEPLKPFNLDLNHNQFTRDHAVPKTLFDHENLGYTYDNLQVGGHSLDDLEHLIHDNQHHARVFAGFLLHGIKTSASVKISLCKGKKCTRAGQFNLLGGPLEAPWAYDRLYKREITPYLANLDLHPEDVFDPTLQVHVEVQVEDVQGHVLDTKNILPQPTIIFDPPHDVAQEVASTSIAGIGVRKDVSRLSTSEIENIRDALRQVQNDPGPNGAQNIASFHGSPARCEHDHHPVACCVHGSPNFPQWHRLYVKQWEDALTAHGAKIGIPYWDWTHAFNALPSLVTETDNHNPFHHGTTHDGHITTRAPRSQLFNDPEFGDESFFYRQVLLAFEQTDYCDFEVQFEITHNAIHSWVGGQSPYGLSTLEYTAYDPLFLLHHSNVDRQFAIWQALQKHRGLPYNTANCAIQDLRQRLRPFSDRDNVNPTTRANSRAIDVFDSDSLHYQYDDLKFHGHSIAELDEILNHNKEEDRIFAEFLLHGLKTSADVSFDLCDEERHCEFAGTFAVLGGPLEMAWEFDRLFEYDVTNVFQKLHLQADSRYHFHLHITAVNGTHLDDDLIKLPSVHFVPGVKKPRRAVETSVPSSKLLVRKNVNQLSQDEAVDLRNALHRLQQDQGPGGFEAIAGFHGAPFLCPENGQDKYACCVHGMPVFPHWHRLFTVQFEQALQEHGSHTGIPYWDWTNPGKELPLFLADTGSDNPFSSYTISFAGEKTRRSPLDALFSTDNAAGTSLLYQLTLDALEEEDYCHFEIMLEFLHNRIHFLIGGTETYSMSTLDYSAYDPIFMIVHSGMDRLWVLWQELQKLRRKPFVAIECGEKTLHEPLHPFDYPNINTIALTRENAIPDTIFDHHRLGYDYDTIEISSHDAAEVNEIIRRRHSETRVYLGGAAIGIGQSLRTETWVLNSAGEKFSAGTNFLLGSSREMPWSNEILWKFDITNAVRQAGLPLDKNIKFHFTIESYNQSLIAEASDYAIFVVREAYTDYQTINVPVGVSYPLPSKLVVPKNTHIRFLPVSADFDAPIENLVSYTNFNKCTLPPFSFDSYAVNVIHSLQPGDYYFASPNKEACVAGKKIYIHVQDH